MIIPVYKLKCDKCEKELYEMDGEIEKCPYCNSLNFQDMGECTHLVIRVNKVNGVINILKGSKDKVIITPSTYIN